ncbi:MAG: DUF1838 family protein [Gammaproteobacteria bacterium]|jgi:hypothetical protein|nr:DUF1838 family protein [Gammaproteobacteria bacterium]
MSDKKSTEGMTIDRRSLLASIGAAGAMSMSPSVQAQPCSKAVEWTLDLEKPKDNLRALLKLQADLSGADALSGFPGKVWGWVPGKGNTLLFNTYGIGCSHIEEVEDGYRFYHRELLYYIDPVTNEVLDTWENPYTGKTVEVRHILNDPVNRFYPFSGGRFAPPYPYEVHGNDIVFQLSIFQFRESPMSRAEYPMHSADDNYQSAELWGMIGRMEEVMDPDITSASCVTSWSRIGQWLPFMEMGDAPGIMAYHSHSYKLMGGAAELPAEILAYTEKNYPKYLESPKKWKGLGDNRSQVTESKREIDLRWKQDGPAGPVFTVK